MILTMNGFSGMRPRYTRFAVPDGGASYCENVIFENGSIVPAAAYLFTIANGETGLPSVPPDSNSEVTGATQLVFDNEVKPRVEIIKPNYVLDVSGTQTVFIYLTGPGTGGSSSSTTEFPEGGATIARQSTGYHVGLYPVARAITGPGGWSYLSSNILNIVNKVTVNGKGMYANATPYYTDPSVPTGTIEVFSETNGKPVTLQIVGAVSGNELPKWYGNGAFPGQSPHVPITLFLQATESYNFSAIFRFRFSLLDASGETIYTSGPSDAAFMSEGDGVRVHIPAITEDEIPIPISRFKIYRSIDNGAYQEISITNGDLV